MVDLPSTVPQPPRSNRLIRRLRVTVESGPDAGKRCAPDDGTLSIGTSPDNTLVLADPAVSRYHLDLRHAASGLYVVDLGSLNGTWLGGANVERATVPAGTRLRIGDTTLAIEDAGTTVAPSSDEVPRLPDLVGESEAIREIERLVHKLARVDSSVLVHGETGVGKEVVARALHDASARRSGKLVVVDCGSLPAALVASTLFGHEKGAFTGADQRRVGAFESAHGGTVLLDEIGELPLELQPALLGVLERKTFTRVGGKEVVATDARILSATHRDLRAEVNAGRFRADLYYRLAVAKIAIPPLRDRPEDIEPLVLHYTQRITGVAELGPLATALDALKAHPWSGNARELRNVVEAALVMGEVKLPTRSRPARRGAPGQLASYKEARAAVIADFEADYLKALIERAEGNASEAARLAHMDRPYLLTLLRKHGLRQ